MSSKPVFVPRETFTDSPIDIVQEVLGALFARVTRFENLQFTTGDGVTEAEGFLTHCATHAAALAAGTWTSRWTWRMPCPRFIEAQGTYMASDTTIKYLRKLKTGVALDKRYLWGSAFEDGTAGHTRPSYTVLI